MTSTPFVSCGGKTLTSVSPLGSTRRFLTWHERFSKLGKLLPQKTADDNKIFSVEAVKSVQEDFYFDDLLKAVETPRKAISLAHELMALLRKGGFRLTKWPKSSREVVANPSINGIDQL